MGDNDLYYNNLYAKYINLNHKVDNHGDEAKASRHIKGNWKSSNRVRVCDSKKLITHDIFKENEVVRPKIRHSSQINNEKSSSDNKNKSYNDPFSMLLIESKERTKTLNNNSNSYLQNFQVDKNMLSQSHNTSGFKTNQFKMNNMRREKRIATNIIKQPKQANHIDDDLRPENRRRTLSNNKNLLLTSSNKQLENLGNNILSINNNNMIQEKLNEKTSDLVIEKRQSVESIEIPKIKIDNKTIIEADENIEKEAFSFNTNKIKGEERLKIETNKGTDREVQTSLKIASVFGKGSLENPNGNEAHESSFDSESESKSNLIKLTQIERIEELLPDKKKLVLGSEDGEHNLTKKLTSLKKPITNTNATRAHKLNLLEDEKEILKQQRGSLLKEVTTANKDYIVDVEREIISLKSNTQFFVDFNNSIGSIPGNIHLSISNEKNRKKEYLKANESVVNQLLSPIPLKAIKKSRKILGCLPLCY